MHNRLQLVITDHTTASNQLWEVTVAVVESFESCRTSLGPVDAKKGKKTRLDWTLKH